MKKNSRGNWVRPGQAPMYIPASEEEQEHPEKCLSSAIVHRPCALQCAPTSCLEMLFLMLEMKQEENGCEIWTGEGAHAGDDLFISRGCFSSNLFSQVLDFACKVLI